MLSSCDRRYSTPTIYEYTFEDGTFAFDSFDIKTNHHDNVRQNVAVFEQKITDLLESEAEIFAYCW